MKTGRPNLATILVLLGLATVGAFVLSLCLGPEDVPVHQVLRALTGSRPAEVGDARASVIVLHVRLPRAVLALLVGAALAVSGMVMQGFFQNPMANPYLLGVSSGASLGATIGLVAAPGLASVFGTWMGLTNEFGLSVSVLAFAGALAVTFVVYILSRVGGRTPVGTLLLTGIAVGSLASALSAYLYIRQPYGLHNVTLWLMGSFQKADGPRMTVMAVAALAGIAVTALFCRDLNVMAMGDETAQHLGVEVARVRKILLVVASLLAASAVAVVGVIGFVGLVVPHLMRLMTGPRHERLLPACVMGGGTLMLLADVMARPDWASRLVGSTLWGLLPPNEVPIGIITAFIGCPFFLYLLRRSRRVQE